MQATKVHMQLKDKSDMKVDTPILGTNEYSTHTVMVTVWVTGVYILDTEWVFL